MEIKPILFSTPMVQAILEDRKTQTRRIICKNDDFIHSPNIICTGFTHGRKIAHFRSKGAHTSAAGFNPKYQPGDILWVRESVKILSYSNVGGVYDYEYDYQFEADKAVVKGDKIPKRIVVNHINDLLYPDLYGTWLTKKQKVPNGCLKEMARLFLEVTNVRVERLQDISEEDAIVEGLFKIKNKNYGDDLYPDFTGDPKLEGKGMGWYKAQNSFRSLWESINGRESWDANPWVWVYDFKQVEKPENFLK